MREKLTNNLGLKLLAFVIAALMWLLVVNSDDPITPVTFSDIPVSVVNDEIITESNRTFQIVDNTQTVKVTVTAQRSVAEKIRAEDIRAVADMRELTMGTQVPIKVTVEGYAGRYEEAYSTPRNLQVQIDEEARNNFPIVPVTYGTVREGYVVGDVSVEPENVTIRGPKKVIESISRVCAEADVADLSEEATLEARLTLYDANNNVIDQTLLVNSLDKDELTVKVNLYQTKNLPIQVDTSAITAAEDYVVSSVSVEPKELAVMGDENNMRRSTEIRIPAEELELSDLRARTEATIDVSPYLPNGLTLVEENASNVVVSVMIEQPGTKTYEVSINSILVNNLDDKLELDYGSTVDLEIQIKGPEEVMEVFSIAKKVSIDLKGYTEAGTYTVPVSVELPNGCSLVKDVSVDVILEKKKAR